MKRRIINTLFVEAIKFTPIVISLWLVIVGVLFLCHVKNSDLEYSLLGHSMILNLTILLGSLFFRFCLWHRILIFNLLLVNLLEWTNNRWWHFSGTSSVRLVLLLLTTGILISTILYFKHGCFKTTTFKGS